MFRELRNFVLRGNVLDLAVGIVFGTIVNSLVKDIIMPPVAYLLGVVNLNDLFFVIKDGSVSVAPYHTLSDATAAGALTWNYGSFVSTIVSFLIIALSIFFVVDVMHRLKHVLASRHHKKSIGHTSGYCPICSSPVSPETGRCPVCDI
jgi:large conductance mechanosensitive channel